LSIHSFNNAYTQLYANMTPSTKLEVYNNLRHARRTEPQSQVTCITNLAVKFRHMVSATGSPGRHVETDIQKCRFNTSYPYVK